MAPPYSQGPDPGAFRYAHHHHRHHDPGSTSLLDDCLSLAAHANRWLWRTWGQWTYAVVRGFWAQRLRNLRRDLTMRRLFSFPHLLAGLWLVLLLWGERWVFHTRVQRCQWDRWEDWPSGATPHHAVLVADPQLVDPHTYPGRPWPLSSLTLLITDNYLGRSYKQLLDDLVPDTMLFLGDLFDGGREWKTNHGESKDPAWSHRPAWEAKFAKVWTRKYGENFWLNEYARFGDIFIQPWVRSAVQSSPQQRGRKLIASLPGNHDLGFGSEVKVAVRERFETYFGPSNRVDVIGNHTFVSVDTVSLSADTSDELSTADLQTIYKPTEHFLNDLAWLKRKAVARELRHQRGQPEEVQFKHRIEELDHADFQDRPTLDPGEKGAAELPTILLSHVPLFRPAGTPCGPLREHWPPSKPPKGSKTAVSPDTRNALSIARGYQYQNVLSQEDSVKIASKLGTNVVHAFSGDDHDYCEVVHDATQGGMREITVKSISMAMGVPTPGFLMVSLYNPIDAEGRPLPGRSGAGDKPTIQTHLCLLPNQLSTYETYLGAVVCSLILLALRAVLVPTLGLSRFALDPTPHHAGGAAHLSAFKAKMDDDDEYGVPSAVGYSASSRIHSSSSSSSKTNRGRSPSVTRKGSSNGQTPRAHAHTHAAAAEATPRSGGGKPRRHSKGAVPSSAAGKWGWAAARGPRIEIWNDDDEEAFYDGGKWKPAASGRSRPRSLAGVVLRELVATTWRVAWIVVAFLVCLTWKG